MMALLLFLLLWTGDAQAAPWCQSLEEARAAGPGYPRYRVRQGQRCWYTSRSQLARRKPAPQEPQGERKLPGAPTPTPLPKPHPEPPGVAPARIEAARAPLRVTEPFDEIADYVTTPQNTTKPDSLRPLAVTFLASLGVVAGALLLLRWLTAGQLRRL